MFARRNAANQRVDACQTELNRLNKIREELEKKWKARDEAVGEAKKAYGNLLEQVEALLLLLHNARQQRDTSRKRIRSLQQRLQLAGKALQGHEQALLKEFYVQQHLRVITPFGTGTVISFDPDTDRVKIKLLWNTRWSSRDFASEVGDGSAAALRNRGEDQASAVAPLVATVTMQADVVMHAERSRQAEERRLMALEEKRCRTVNTYLKRLEGLETQGMRADDHYAQQLRNVEILNDREEEHVVKAVKIIAEECRLVILG